MFKRLQCKSFLYNSPEIVHTNWWFKLCSSNKTVVVGDLCRYLEPTTRLNCPEQGNCRTLKLNTSCDTKECMSTSGIRYHSHRTTTMTMVGLSARSATPVLCTLYVAACTNTRPFHQSGRRDEHHQNLYTHAALDASVSDHIRYLVERRAGIGQPVSYALTS